MSALDHPNLVRLYGVQMNKTLRLVLEFVPGGDLCHDFHAPFPEAFEELKELKRRSEALQEQEAALRASNDIDKVDRPLTL